MSIKQIEIDVNGMPHTVQVNDVDTNAAPLADRFREKAVKPAEAKSKQPANKAKQPANKQASRPKGDSGVEDASDPSASE